MTPCIIRHRLTYSDYFLQVSVKCSHWFIQTNIQTSQNFVHLPLWAVGIKNSVPLVTIREMRYTPQTKGVNSINKREPNHSGPLTSATLTSTTPPQGFTGLHRNTGLGVSLVVTCLRETFGNASSYTLTVLVGV